MFEARLGQATILKKILDAIKDLLNEGTFDCSDSGIQVRHTKHICFFQQLAILILLILL